jgi:hypothetical protein
MNRAAMLVATGGGGFYDRLWADGLSTAARHMDKTRPGKCNRNGSHKQNARKVKKGSKA